MTDWTARRRTGLQRWTRQSYRDLRVLARLFPWRAGLAGAAGLALAALVFQRAYVEAYGPSAELSYVKAVYAILNMAAFQVSYADMPPGPQLDLFFVIVPLISIPMLLVFGANLFHVVRVFFVKRDRGQVWQRALAATTVNPIVVCGLGHVGYRVASQLLDLQRPIVGVEAKESALTQSLIDQDVPVILGDVRDKEVLRSAGVERATTVIVCTHSDLANIEAVFHVRELNPHARVVMRLFEDELADELTQHFDVQHIISRSAIAAQGFAYAALGMEVLETFEVSGEGYALVRISVSHRCPLLGTPLSRITELPLSTIVCLYRGGAMMTAPPPETILQVDDHLFVFTHLDILARLLDCGNARHEGTSPRPIVVCGLGHTGYRVVKILHSLGRSVRALDFAPSTLSERLANSGFSVTYGDFRTPAVLASEGVPAAEALIVCTEDDMVNFETMIRAQELVHRESAPTDSPGEQETKPGGQETRMVIRIFEDALGHKLQTSFGIDAVISSSAMAAPAFVAAALNIHLSQSVLVGGRSLLLARMGVTAPASLSHAPTGELIVLLHQRGDKISIPPEPSLDLRSGDEIVILATHEKLRALSLHNGASARHADPQSKPHQEKKEG